MRTVKKIRNRIGWTLAFFMLLLNISMPAIGQDPGSSGAGPARLQSSSQAPIPGEPTGYDRPNRASIDVNPPNGDPGLKTPKGSKDLTGFFAIGFIINILAIGAFLYWAAGQWRKKR